MRKKVIVIVFIVLAMVLLIPIPTGVLRDGGTKTYTAVLYRIVVWHRIDDSYPGGFKTGTEVQFIPNNFRDF